MRATENRWGNNGALAIKCVYSLSIKMLVNEEKKESQNKFSVDTKQTKKNKITE